MKINIFVKTNAKKEFVEKTNDNESKVSVSTQPIEGKANTKVIELLARFFNVPKSAISLIRGTKSKNKVFEIL